MKRLALLTITIASLLSGVVAAQSELVLQDDQVLHGRVVSTTADSVTFQFQLGDQSETETFKAEELHPLSFYIVRSHAELDAAGHEALGDFCLAHDLFSRGRSQYYEAIKADPSRKDALMARILEGHEGTAALLLDKAKKEQATTDAVDAWIDLSDLIRYYPGTPAATAARPILATLHEQRAKAMAERLAKQESIEGNEVLKRAKDDVQKADELNHKGMQAKEQSEQERSFKQAIEQYERALKAAQELPKAEGAGTSVAAASASLVTEAKNGLVETYENLGAIYSVRGDFQGALAQANKAIAVDPTSAAARSFRVRVLNDSATASSIGVVSLAPAYR